MAQGHMDQFIDLTTGSVADTRNPPLSSFAAPLFKWGRRFRGGGFGASRWCGASARMESNGIDFFFDAGACEFVNFFRKSAKMLSPLSRECEMYCKAVKAEVVDGTGRVAGGW